jgi:hypothetical protein
LAFPAVVEPFVQWRLSLAYGSLTLPIALLVALMDWPIGVPARSIFPFRPENGPFLSHIEGSS